MSGRDFDVVLYGASGFTGSQTVDYFRKHAPKEGFRWAIAGRSREKLAAVLTRLGISDIEILVADSSDQAAIDGIVSRTSVILTTAGPFAKYGTPIVDACVRFGTHYVDITGETVWVRELIDRYHEKAAQSGTRIVPFCGFDSIPSDLGAFVVAEYIRKQLGTTCSSVHAYFSMSGGVNGGTIATAFNMYESGQAAAARDPFILNPRRDATPAQAEANADVRNPSYSSEIDSWVGPFIMGPINTRVVRRSNALFAETGEAYGLDFTYQEYMKFGGPLGWLPATALTSGGALFQLAMETPLRPLLKSVLPQPGSGPSEKTMDEGWFKCDLVGKTEDGRVVKGRISDQGDPGNRATVKFLCESALCLALQAEELPGGKGRGGVLTAATAFGHVLENRLRNAGMKIEVSG